MFSKRTLLLLSCVCSVVGAAYASVSQAQSGQESHSIVLTDDALNAYLESLRFCLVQIGEGAAYTPELEVQVKHNIHQNFAILPKDVQMDLINARSIWQQYQAQWAWLGINQKKEFGLAVLGLAFGEQAAADALGLSRTGSSAGAAVDVDSIGGTCHGGHCESIGGDVEIDPN